MRIPDHLMQSLENALPPSAEVQATIREYLQVAQLNVPQLAARAGYSTGAINMFLNDRYTLVSKSDVMIRKALVDFIAAQVPPQAAQSKRLVGRHSEATITFGTTLAVNEEGVAHFEDYLRAHGYFDLFLRFFAAETKHRVVEGARDVVKTLTLPKRIEEKIHHLFGRAIEVKTKAPSLAVKTIQPEKPARKPRGGKAAA